MGAEGGKDDETAARSVNVDPQAAAVVQLPILCVLRGANVGTKLFCIYLYLCVAEVVYCTHNFSCSVFRPVCLDKSAKESVVLADTETRRLQFAYLTAVPGRYTERARGRAGGICGFLGRLFVHWARVCSFADS